METIVLTSSKTTASLELFTAIAVGLMIGCEGSGGKLPSAENQAAGGAERTTDGTPAVPEPPELEYDSEAYDRVTSFLETDRTDISVDEFLTEVGLRDAEFTVLSVVNTDLLNRIYHCDGFYVSLYVRPLVPNGNFSEVAKMHERNEVVIASSWVCIDGLTDPMKRMKEIERSLRSRFLEPDRAPELRITAVTVPTQRSLPLQISLQLDTRGATPLTFSQDQLTVRISTAREPYIFACDAVFDANEQQVFTIEPKQPMVLSFSTSTNRFGDGETWCELPRGRYQLSVDLAGPKDREFDYQWSGRTYSNNYALTIE